MSKSSIPPIWAGIARELSRRARHHADESRRLREQYTSGFPVRQRSVRALGCDTNVYETVPGTSRHPPLLLIHGGVIEAASWMAALGETPGLGTGRRVLLPDLPAHGASAFLAPSRLLAWLEAFVDSEIGHQPFDLCGHSMGGAIALYYAARHGGRLRRLVLCAPAGTGQVLPRVWPEPWNTGLLDFWPLHKPLIEKVWGDPAALTDEQRLQFGVVFRDFFYSLRWWWYLSGGLRWLLDIPEATLRGVRCPALFIWGEKDRVVHFNGRRTLGRVQQIPGARIHFLTGLGHLPQVESPAAFNRVVHEFLNA